MGNETDTATWFSGPQVCKLAGITYRQLDYWDRTDLLKPELANAKGSGTQRRYSYRDLVRCKVIKSLLDAGIKLQTARQAISSLRAERGDDWQTASLILDGAQSVLVLDEDGLVDVVRGRQGVLLNVIPVGSMKAELDAAIEELHPSFGQAFGEAVADSDDAPRRVAQGG